MDREVRVTVTGVHKHPGLEPQETKSESKGLMREENGKYIIEYEEYLSEEAPEDFQGGVATYNKITITQDQMSIVRKGSVESELSFKNGLEHVSDYKTPFGAMKTRVHTTRYNLYSLAKGNRLIAEAEYRVAMNGMSLSEALMRVDIT